MKQRHLMPTHAARVAGQTAPFPVRRRLGEAEIRDACVAAVGSLCKAGHVSPRGWAGAGLDAAFRVFHHQRVAFTYPEC